jgi:hypothetical protein
MTTSALHLAVVRARVRRQLDVCNRWPGAEFSWDEAQVNHQQLYLLLRRCLRRYDLDEWPGLSRPARIQLRKLCPLLEFPFRSVQGPDEWAEMLSEVFAALEETQQTTSQAGDSSLPPPVRPEEMLLLKKLNMAYPQTVLEADDELGLSRRSIGLFLERLRSLGLTHRPLGERSGEAITLTGRALLENFTCAD